tara:strand:- start:4348 stop:5256 length:909 start_codon:yes stop_codon:yes gene_type:complete
MEKKIFLFFFILFFLKTDLFYPQYTEIINSNRPGHSSGAFSVGKNILQFENGINFVNEKHESLNYETKGYSFDFKIRYGLFYEQLELIVDGVYQKDKFNDLRNTTENIYNRRNLKKFQIGAKYLIFDPKKGIEEKGPSVFSYHKKYFDPNNPNKSGKFNLNNLIPAISVFAGLNIDSKNNPHTNPEIEGLSPSFAVFTQNNFLGRSAIISNWVFQRLGTSQSDFEYLISLTYAFSENYIGFVESHGIKSDFYADNKFSLGLAYLYNDNFQIDLGTTLNFKETPKINYFNIGLSFRLDLYANK